MDECFVRLLTLSLGRNGLLIGRRHRARRPVRTAFAIGIHDAKIVLRVLIEVFGGDPVAAGGRFARQGHVAFENLVGVAANFYVWTITVESLNPMRHPRTVVMRIAPITTAARSLVWSWSHDTCLIVVDTVGPMSGESVPWPLSGGCRPVYDVFPGDGEPPSSNTLVGKAANSNNFLHCLPGRMSHDTARDTGEIELATLDRQSVCL